jgi:hypothetical protein
MLAITLDIVGEMGVPFSSDRSPATYEAGRLLEKHTG